MKLARIDFVGPTNVAPFGQVTGLTRKMAGSSKEIDIELREDTGMVYIGKDIFPITFVAHMVALEVPAPKK